MKERNLTLSQKQLKTWMVIQRFIQKDITRQQAADLLGLSTRQISRLKKGVLTSGPESLIHKNTGRKPAHAVKEETKEAILSLYSQPEFSEVNFLHFQEILLADFGISLSCSALSSILKNAGKESPKKKKSENVPIAANESLIPGSSFKSMRLPSHGLAVLPNTPSTAPLTMPPERWSACF